jgi:hypothetical protein
LVAYAGDLTLAAAVFGGILILGYQKWSAAKASHYAGGNVAIEARIHKKIALNVAQKNGL